jgi:uncharacterized protein YndB with AHSA1/START domain
MKWILIAVASLASLIGIAALVGSRLPRSHRSSREHRLPASAEAIWSAITDVEAFPAWRADVTRVQRLPDREGLPVWIEEGRSGKITFAVERLERPRLLVARIADPDLPFGGTWTYEVTPDKSGSLVRITEDGEIYNPLFRFMARFIFGYEATLASYLSDLDKRFTRAASSRQGI